MGEYGVKGGCDYVGMIIVIFVVGEFILWKKHLLWLMLVISLSINQIISIDFIRNLLFYYFIFCEFHYYHSQAIVLAILDVYLLIFTVMLIKLKNPTDYYAIMRT